MITKTQKLIQDQFTGYLADYEVTGDTESLVKFFNMYKDGKLKISAVDRDSVGFLPYNKGNGKCTRCGCVTLKGSPIFYMNKAGWCLNCATNTEKENTYYKNYIKKQNLPTKQPVIEYADQTDNEDLSL